MSRRFVSGSVIMKLNNRKMIRLGQTLIGGGIIILVLPFENSTLFLEFFTICRGYTLIFPSLLHKTPRNLEEKYSQAIIKIQITSI
jgi:hypothetical protein